MQHTAPKIHLRQLPDHKSLLFLRTIRKYRSGKCRAHFRSYVTSQSDNNRLRSLDIAALMSNHSAEYPNGILDKETLKSFFAITEAADGTLSWTPGHERIPDNWYLHEALSIDTTADQNQGTAVLSAPSMNTQLYHSPKISCKWPPLSPR